MSLGLAAGSDHRWKPESSIPYSAPCDLPGSRVARNVEVLGLVLEGIKAFGIEVDKFAGVESAFAVRGKVNPFKLIYLVDAPHLNIQRTVR
jgi:hypothetical protein